MFKMAYAPPPAPPVADDVAVLHAVLQRLPSRKIQASCGAAGSKPVHQVHRDRFHAREWVRRMAREGGFTRIRWADAFSRG